LESDSAGFRLNGAGLSAFATVARCRADSRDFTAISGSLGTRKELVPIRCRPRRPNYMPNVSAARSGKNARTVSRATT
jgi:hypothetical protein